MRQITTMLGPMWVHDQDHLGQVLETGVFWDAQIKPYLDSAPANSLVIDIGASVGFISRYLLTREHHVIAVEAWPDTGVLLGHNLAGLDTNGHVVQIIRGVAYDRPCLFSLAPAAFLGWPTTPQSPNVSSYAFLPDPWNGVIPGVVLDEVVSDFQHNISPAPVGLIKVDAQGCDLRALRGLRQTIVRDRPLILFEFEEAASSWQGDIWWDYEQFFARHAYDIRRIREDIWDYVAVPS